MKLSLLLTTLLSITVLTAQDSFKKIQLPPEQKGQTNLLPDPLMQPSEKNPTVLKTWSNYGGRKLKLSWNEIEGQKVLQTVSDTPGYHMGIRGEAPLQPNTEYLYYAVIRGELAPEAKFVPLYLEVKAGPEKKTVLTRSAGRITKSFPWTLYSKKFKTPATFTTGTGAFYLGLIYGSSKIDYACAGLIKLDAAQPGK